MREIEIRRHSCTKKGPGRGKGSHLSADGVALAREVAQGLEPFDLVLATDVPRTTETAIAMGCAVDDALVCPVAIVKPAFDAIGHQERWGWHEPWARFRDLAETNEAVAALGTWLREAWTQALTSVADGGRVLVISHGRMIETGVVACLPNATLAGWGEPLHHCEGVSLDYKDGAFGNPRIMRARRCTGGR